MNKLDSIYSYGMHARSRKRSSFAIRVVLILSTLLFGAWGSGNLGGGAGYNFKVVASTAQPANPQPNTIWIKTDDAISSWVFSASSPGNPLNGTLWVQVSGVPTYGFQAVKDNKNKLYTYPTGARLYKNNAWELVAAYIWRGTAWEQFQSIFGPSSFSYTGQVVDEDDGNGNWRKKFLTSGILTCAGSGYIDAFLVGGGAGGSNGQGCRGGGGGYTSTHSAIALSGGDTYTIVIGAGGTVAGAGGQTSGFGYSANGGALGTQPAGTGGYYCKGGNGGSGGGASAGSEDTGLGGTNGGNGTGNSYGVGGTGQGTTTREFGEPTGALYAGGGGASYGTTTGQGGAGGGGTNADGQTNTGGGGASKYADGTQTNYAGGSGIIVIRNMRVA